ncbi:general transcription factor 3C polypeptide 5-like [Phoenicopterus ruber ruber]
MAAGRCWGELGSAVLELPRTPRLVCVEYPGVVRDVGAMLRTLGGEQGVSRVRGPRGPGVATGKKIGSIQAETRTLAKRLELYFRPKDPYCHPVCANRFPTSTVLLKVKRRTKKKKQLDTEEQIQSEVQFEMEILGTVTTIYKFQGMSDFQYLAMHSGPDGKPTSMYDKVLMLKPEKEEFFNRELPLYIPPPIFSRLDTPVDYFYRPDIQHRGVTRVFRVTILLDATVTTVFSSMVVSVLLELFEVHPVWSRNAVQANIIVHPDKLKLLLPYLAAKRQIGEHQVFLALYLLCRTLGYAPNDMPVKAKRSTYNYSLPITVKKPGTLCQQKGCL